MPMVASSHAAIIVQALLHDRPFATCCENETMQINLESVRDGIVIEARGKRAGAHEIVAIYPARVGDFTQLLRRVAGESAAPAADVNAELAGPRGEATLESAHDRRGNARRMPVHSHHGA